MSGVSDSHTLFRDLKDVTVEETVLESEVSEVGHGLGADFLT
jgi:hypothetical protein